MLVTVHGVGFRLQTDVQADVQADTAGQAL
jgi:hypothetical protein